MQKGNLRSVTSFKASIISLATGLIWFMIAYIPDFNPLTVIGFVFACSSILIGVITMLQMNSSKTTGLIFAAIQFLFIAVILITVVYSYVGTFDIRMTAETIALREKMAYIYLIPCVGLGFSAVLFLKGRKEFTEINL